MNFWTYIRISSFVIDSPKNNYLRYNLTNIVVIFSIEAFHLSEIRIDLLHFCHDLSIESVHWDRAIDP